jgi:hypothetical protein
VETQARAHAAGYEFAVDWLLGRDPRAMTSDELQLQIRAINIRGNVLNSQHRLPWDARCVVSRLWCVDSCV